MPIDPNVQFKRGLLANLQNQAVVDGTIYVTTDEHAMYVDNGSSRIRLGDFIPVNTVEDLPAAGHAYETAVYYVKEGNILARWDSSNSKWIQINKAGVVGVTNVSTGSVVSGITVQTDDVGQLTLRVTKTNVASTADLQALIARVDVAENDIDTLQSQMTTLLANDNTPGSIAYQLKAATDALINSETTYTDFKTIGDAIRSLAATQSSQGTRLTTVEGVASGAANAAADNAAAIAVLNGDASTEGSVAAAVAAEATARSTEDTRLAGLISTNTSNISGLTTRVSNLEDLPGRVEDLEDAVDTLNGDAQTAGSVANTVATEIARVVDGAPETFDTLKEIATWIGTHNNDAAALISRVTAAENAITAEATAREAADDDLQDAIDLLNGDAETAGSVANTVATAIGTLPTDVTTLQGQMAAAQSTIGTHTTQIAGLRSDVDTLMGDANTAGSVANAVAAEAAARTAEDTRLAGLISTNTTNISTNAANISSLQTRMSTAETNINTLADALTWQAF